MTANSQSQSPPASGSSSNNSRRPPRKSTLTQQQKNQKRQRATQEQLVVLEQEFIKNPTPTASVRERIADDINMTERSVQIWFQNRRAKIKLMAKKSIETGEECGEIPDSMRQYLAMQSGADSNRGLYPGYGNNYMAADPTPTGKVLINHLTCRSLSVGTWRRIAQKNMDLIVFYSPTKASMTYYINNDAAGYKIEYPFAHIKSIDYEQSDDPVNDGRLVVELERPPNFYMDNSNSGGFVQLGDFTENAQASRVLTHYLGGPSKVILQQLAKLKTMDVFINRHNTHNTHMMSMGPPMNMFDNPAFSISAPVSPGIIRPASCSNDTFSQPTFKLQPPESFHRHKRTRSRSVPVAIDFSQHSMSSLSNMGQFGNFSFGSGAEHLYAPAPQHALGNGLRIDTSNANFMNFQSYPMSATTASPSEYNSPPLMTAALHTGDMNGSFGTPYTASWGESPSLDAASLGPSVSPLSMGHSDPVMGESPQMTAIRSSSADLFPMSEDYSSDRALMNELYSKPLDDLSLEDGSDLEMHLMQQNHLFQNAESTVV